MLQLVQMALAKKPTDSFFNTDITHPHFRLHILISILAVIVVSSAIWIYKINMDKSNRNVIETAMPAKYSTTAEELRLIAEKISSGPSESPPTQAEMEKMALKMSKQNTGQVTLSNSDLELQAQILNK